MNKLLKISALLLFSITLAACDRFNKGQSAANESPVPDGCIVLVRQGMDRGAFILNNQRTTPETTDFEWFARSDGGGKLVSTDPSVTTGKANGVKEIRFPGFAIDWSINTNGKGWVYFSVLPTDIKTPPKFEMCITDETDITRIDANDSKWIYRERPSVNSTALIKP